MSNRRDLERFGINIVVRNARARALKNTRVRANEPTVLLLEGERLQQMNKRLFKADRPLIDFSWDECFELFSKHEDERFFFQDSH